MLSRRCLASVCLLWMSGPVLAGPTDDFAKLLDDHWEWRLREFPVGASALGEHRFNDRWRDRSIEAIERRHGARVVFRDRLATIDAAQLPPAGQLDYELFRRILQNDIDRHRFRDYLIPVSHRGGTQTLEETTERIPLATLEDYEDWLERMRGIEQVLEQTMALQELGRESGYMPAAILMQRVPAQIASQLVERIEDSPFYAAFRDLPDVIAEADSERLRTTAKQLIGDKIIPAYQRFNAYFVDSYLPACRERVGVSSLPDGEAYYEHLTRRFTTTSLSPDEIHDLGLTEVSRIRAEMQAVIDELEYEGDFASFLNFLRTDPQFYYDDPDQLYEAYLATSKRIDPQLLKLFGRLPRMPYGVRPIPANVAPDTTTAYYSRPAADGSRAGYYYVNLYKPEVRPKYEIEVLTVHEAVPGHHLQIALAQELDTMPAFRRYTGFTAFSEGWGLYSEGLGYELGLYQDPYSKFGQLTYDMWRAVRLVVDTGMHSKGWSRQQAIDFFKDNAAKTELDIVNEIDRYIGNPGQALAYKIGQMKMQSLRKQAETELGDRFDIREFHDELLGGGAVPLDILETRMQRWLKTKTR